MYAASLLSSFVNEPSEVHMGTAKRVLRYLRGTTDYGVQFQPCSDVKLIAYSDSDWAGLADDIKSISGYTFTLGSRVFSWISKKQDTVAQSTAEAEYIAVSTAVNQALWLRKIFQDMGQKQVETTQVNVDNKSAIAITKNPVCHSKIKHMKVKFHAIRDAEQDKEVKMVYCQLEYQLADIFTKALLKIKFEFLKAKLGMIRKSLKEEC